MGAQGTLEYSDYIENLFINRSIQKSRIDQVYPSVGWSVSQWAGLSLALIPV